MGKIPLRLKLSNFDLYSITIAGAAANGNGGGRDGEIEYKAGKRNGKRARERERGTIQAKLNPNHRSKVK